ncbi:MAG: histidine--tRNA ligase [Chloroflexota bacterium]
MIQAIRGAKDILPDSAASWQFLYDVCKKASEQYGYSELRTPIFEKTEVFSRGVGEETDIVGKEMYTFTDRGGESVTLRPEATAALVRAVIQNSLVQEGSVSRLWYFGPFFRYERPQKGRLRQFHQYGAECLNSPNPEADVETLLLAKRIINGVGIDSYKLLINSLGNGESRAAYRAALVDYLRARESSLSGESVRRLETNPLRVLDSKDAKDIEILAEAPDILKYLDEDSRSRFDFVINSLEKLGLQYEIDKRLVRGLDYYSHTVFEFRSAGLGSQDSFGGGGRYDGLFEQLGGKPTPAVGFAFGLERILLILEALSATPAGAPSPDAVVVCDDAYFAFGELVAEKLRGGGYRVVSDLRRRSFKAQMRDANRMGARFAVIIGEDEAAKGGFTLKDMLNGGGEQRFVSLKDDPKLEA